MQPRSDLISNVGVLRSLAVLGVIFIHMNANLLPKTSLSTGLSFFRRIFQAS